MIVNMTLSVTLEMPDGTASVDGSGGRAWLLPNGDMVKPWVVLELNDTRDLSFAESQSLGIDVMDVVEDVTTRRGVRRMTRDYRDSEAAAAFIATADSRETSREIMRAIVGFVDSTEEAEIMWQEGLCDWDDASAFVFVNVVTADGRDDPRGFCWGVSGSNWMREFV